MDQYNSLISGHSYSAPKKFGIKTGPVFSFGLEDYQIDTSDSNPNYYNQPTNQNYFFNSRHTKPKHFGLGQTQQDALLSPNFGNQNWEINSKRYEEWMMNGRDHGKDELEPNYLTSTPPPPGFCNTLKPAPPPTFDRPAFRLQHPPKKSLVKRELRGTFGFEYTSQDFFTGKLKFYQLKKRFGFITLDIDESDVFLCEDDLVLSSINIKKFKEDVINRKPIYFTFNMKKYLENGKEKRKAVNVKIID